MDKNPPSKTPQGMIQHWRFKPHNPGESKSQCPRRRRHSSPALENFVHHWKYDPKAGANNHSSNPIPVRPTSPQTMNSGSAPGSRRVSPRATRTSPYNTPRGSFIKRSESMEEIEHHFSLLMKPKMEPIAEDTNLEGGSSNRLHPELPRNKTFTHFPKYQTDEQNSLSNPLILPSLLTQPPSFITSSVPKLPPLGEIALTLEKSPVKNDNNQPSRSLTPNQSLSPYYGSPEIFYHSPSSQSSPQDRDSERESEDSMDDVPTSPAVQKRMSIGNLVS